MKALFFTETEILFDWQKAIVILIIGVTLLIFVRRLFKKKTGEGCAGSGCACDKEKLKKNPKKS
jgi:competence protein ComGC